MRHIEDGRGADRLERLDGAGDAVLAHRASRDWFTNLDGKRMLRPIEKGPLYF